MLISASDYGPFGPAVGYGGAIMAAGAAIFALWGGRMKKWRPPDEDLPGAAQKVVLLLCGVGMVVLWYFATPSALKWFIITISLLLITTVLCFLRYSGLLGLYRYTKLVAASNTSVRQEYVLGGRELRPEAEEERKKAKVDTQTFFEGTAYNIELLWTRESRDWVKKRVLTFFILTLVLGTSALTAASFAVQVILTQRAAASVIRTQEAPGLK